MNKPYLQGDDIIPLPPGRILKLWNFPEESSYGLRVQHSHRSLKLVTMSTLFCVAVMGGEHSVKASDSAKASQVKSEDGSLDEIKDKQSVALVVVRSSVLDAAGDDEPIVREALAVEPRLAPRHRPAYNVIARKINQYIRKYRSLRSADQTSQADFIVYFKLVEYRRMLNGFYPYGEMFVIVNPETTGSPRIIWRTSKIVFAEDAIKELLKDLKQARGER